MMEAIAVRLASYVLLGHHRNGELGVEIGVRELIKPADRFERGGLFPRYSVSRVPSAGFVRRNWHFLSERRSGDARQTG